ncbi:MFS transporter [Streptomyces sp. NPDC091217]|uniref:MFS transporter n=1 Tax=Streptomyces sp. NPDC091217 TaxID=3365975 RepID=UPI0037F5D895
MASTQQIQDQVSPARVAFASAIGTTIEWYDFFIFNTAAALVFGKLFFPTVSPTAGTLAAFATFGVAFAARPIGGIVYGHFGDRLGRKKMLVSSLLLMGLSTFAIGLLPTYGTIGVWSPFLLVALRFAQGFAIGGEWGGAVLMASEYAPKKRRGFYASWPQVGAPSGLVLASGLYFVLTKTLSDDQFNAWGWRIPFLVSVLLVMAGLYIRLRIIESPAFRKVQETDSTSKLPIADVLRTSRKQVFLGICSTFGPNIFFYSASVLALSYVTEKTGVAHQSVLLCLLAAALLEVFVIPVSSSWSDRVGRRPVLIAGAAVGAVVAFPFFWLLDSGSVPLIFISLVLALAVVHGLIYSAQSSFLSELFETRTRYTGSSITYQIGGMLSSGPTPFLAAALLSWTGGTWAISLYMILGSLISIAAIVAARETFDEDTHVEIAPSPRVTAVEAPEATA